MDLLLVRHGVAEDLSATGDDADRALTDKGAAKCRRAALGLANLTVQPTLVWSSPRLRARQTAELLAGDLPIAIRDELDFGSPAPLLAALRELPPTTVLLAVGHEPQFSETVEWLLGASSGHVEMGKAGLAHLSFDPRELPQADAWLISLLTPRQLRALATSDES